MHPPNTSRQQRERSVTILGNQPSSTFTPRMSQAAAQTQAQPQTQAPILKTQWSDAEKLALLLSLLKSTSAGAPKWSNNGATIAVPAGRTLQASQRMYGEILKIGATVKMTSGEAVTPSGTRKRRMMSGFGDGSPLQQRGNKRQRRGNGFMGVLGEDDDEDVFREKEEVKDVKKEEGKEDSDMEITKVVDLDVVKIEDDDDEVAF